MAQQSETAAVDQNLQQVYERLRDIMIPYANDLDLKKDAPGELYIDTNHLMANDKPLFFGAVRINKRYVSYHLMPVYVNTALLDNISAGLRKRMQGKSCLNFTTIDEELFAELSLLTRAGHEFYRRQGYL